MKLRRMRSSSRLSTASIISRSSMPSTVRELFVARVGVEPRAEQLDEQRGDLRMTDQRVLHVPVRERDAGLAQVLGDRPDDRDLASGQPREEHEPVERSSSKSPRHTPRNASWNRSRGGRPRRRPRSACRSRTATPARRRPARSRTGVHRSRERPCARTSAEPPTARCRRG